MTDNTHKRAVLFPGQGSQEKGMGRDLAEDKAEAMELWQIAEKASGLPLREIYWQGDEADMANTRALQPAMTAVTLGLWYAAKSKLDPMGLAGHSLGEYAALAAAGVMEPARTLELVSLRGRLMDEAGRTTDGKMAAILKMTQEQVEELVAKAASQSGANLYLANLNSPGQFVVSGDPAAIEAAAALAKEYKGRAIVLPVSGAFHSPAMAEAAAELTGALAKAELRAAAIPVYLNVTGRPERDPEIIRDLLSRQMTSSVQWIETMKNMRAGGASEFVELGPKGVLAKLVKANLDDANAVGVATLEAVDRL